MANESDELLQMYKLARSASGKGKIGYYERILEEDPFSCEATLYIKADKLSKIMEEISFEESLLGVRNLFDELMSMIEKKHGETFIGGELISKLCFAMNDLLCQYKKRVLYIDNILGKPKEKAEKMLPCIELQYYIYTTVINYHTENIFLRDQAIRGIKYTIKEHLEEYWYSKTKENDMKKMREMEQLIRNYDEKYFLDKDISSEKKSMGVAVIMAIVVVMGFYLFFSLITS